MSGINVRSARRGNCCPHPVERHAYNGCANCGCNVLWVDHPDRHLDTSAEGVEAYQRRLERGLESKP